MTAVEAAQRPITVHDEYASSLVREYRVNALIPEAKEAINSFKPAVIYPYHYGDSDLSPLETGMDAAVDVRLRNWYPG